MDDKRETDPVLAPLAIITPAIAIVVSLPFLFLYAAVAGILALAGGVAFGAPVLSLAHKMKLRGLLLTTTLGVLTAAAGVYLVGFALALIYGGRVGVNPGVLALAVPIGGATGATYATIYDSVNLSPHQVRWRIMTIVLMAVMVPWIAMIARR